MDDTWAALGNETELRNRTWVDNVSVDLLFQGCMNYDLEGLVIRNYGFVKLVIQWEISTTLLGTLIITIMRTLKFTRKFQFKGANLNDLVKLSAA